MNKMFICRYHDDPYLIPLSNYRKRAYALSAEAGRKAAAWIRDEHASLFNTREWDPPSKLKTPYYNADPIIDAFEPKPIYNEESKVSEIVQMQNKSASFNFRTTMS